MSLAKPTERSRACASLGIVAVAWAAAAFVWTTAQPFYASDDLRWLRHVSRGLGPIWSESSPYRHFRPVFGMWWWLLAQADLTSFRALGVAGWALNLALVPTAVFAFRPLLGASAWLTAVLVLIHPARTEHLLWHSAQIDLLCLLISLLVIGQALRAGASQRIGPVTLGALCLSTYFAVLTKEIGLALPLVCAMLPGLSRAARVRIGLSSLVGAVGGLVHILVVLRGGGRAGGLLLITPVYNALLYPTRLLWPSNESYRSQLDAIRKADLVTIAAYAAQLGVIVYGLAMLYRHRSQAWVRLSGLLLLAGLLPWTVVSIDRSIGLGCCGAAMLAVRLAEDSRHRRMLVQLMAPCIALAFTVLWLRATRTWQSAVLEGLAIQRAVQAFHRTSTESLLIIGQPDRIGRSGMVARVEELDPCANSRFILGAVGGVLPRAKLTAIDTDTFELTPDGNAYSGCPKRPPSAVAHCVEGTDGIRFSRSALLRRLIVAPQCGPARLAHWTGKLTLVP